MTFNRKKLLNTLPPFPDFELGDEPLITTLESLEVKPGPTIPTYRPFCPKHGFLDRDSILKIGVLDSSLKKKYEEELKNPLPVEKSELEARLLFLEELKAQSEKPKVYFYCLEDLNELLLGLQDKGLINKIIMQEETFEEK